MRQKRCLGNPAHEKNRKSDDGTEEWTTDSTDETDKGTRDYEGSLGVERSHARLRRNLLAYP
jgi:hypothetical protein